MVELNLQNFTAASPIPAPGFRKPLGTCLVEVETLTQSELDHALHLQSQQNAPLGEILVGEGFATRQDILHALSVQSGWQIANLEQIPPMPGLCDLKPVGFWLKHNVIPWMRVGPLLLVATARPDRFPAVTNNMRDCDYTIIPVLAASDQIDRTIARQFSRPLAEAAETRVDADQSCRNWTIGSRIVPSVSALGIIALFFAFPWFVLATLLAAAVGTLILFAVLRLAGTFAYLRHSFRQKPEASDAAVTLRQPCVSIMVPLYKEREIANALVQRLKRLTYPKALLDVILVLEEKDEVTRATLAKIDLPSWMRIVEVPELDGLTTKPRAMNYALDFCRGDYVGVWDAEDAPQPDQIERVVAHFSQAPPEVVCLQGSLDYYNPRTNWRSRCFTIEYNSWFRIILPGIARLGLVVPLGGTTFFFRRDKLLELGGWDAHNVTEDADLGVRLCRAGYRTELVDTTTYEEANFRAWPWVKQRSRWLKGFMVTYLVHMRSAKRLLRDLGAAQFLGLQAFFLGTLGQFLLAPVLWVFWPSTLGLSNPLAPVLPQNLTTALVLLFLTTEALNICVGCLAVSARERRFLLPWVPTMALYYPLGVVAAYKALWELATNPFFWDKTQHGQASEDQPLA
ncbi:glycosyltransferase family 2 protein [Ruegeria sp. HKCCD7318]|uniref:glycosyltransferase family 2 protein n=1 Tax=Ruegeria sp. HKCCD7318 TaxID=2683014 RepID=UPI0014923FFB|nr:glycosyltransferase family 2 protein [Ruegeria sp. HKCCD7318]NOE33194.1 glycosyltransferase [Ruegeria sp. HKCCD7318]